MPLGCTSVLLEVVGTQPEHSRWSWDLVIAPLGELLTENAIEATLRTMPPHEAIPRAVLNRLSLGETSPEVIARNLPPGLVVLPGEIDGYIARAVALTGARTPFQAIDRGIAAGWIPILARPQPRRKLPPGVDRTIRGLADGLTPEEVGRSFGIMTPQKRALWFDGVCQDLKTDNLYTAMRRSYEYGLIRSGASVAIAPLEAGKPEPLGFMLPRYIDTPELDDRDRAIIRLTAMGYDYPQMPQMASALSGFSGDYLRYYSRGLFDKVGAANKTDLAVKGIVLGLVPYTSQGEPIRLPKREAQVSRYIAKGLGDIAIANALALKEPTVKMHVRRLIERTQSHSRAHAILRLFELGNFVAVRRLSGVVGRIAIGS